MRLRPIIICSNDVPGLTLTYFTPGSNFVVHALYGKKEIMDFWEIIAASDLKAGRYSQLNE